ncbi:MAG: 2OG-Fe(II) oxygenase [Paracoccaceae bacterium]
MIASLDAKVWNINPLVATVDDFLSNQECTDLMGLTRGRMRRARVSSTHAVDQVSEARTNQDCSLSPADFPQILPVLMKLGMALRMPVTHAEPLIVLHYQGGEEFKPHFDGYMLKGDPEVLARFEARGGQRLFSTMIYLNAVESGGETEFDQLGVSVSPAPGRLVVWGNCMAGSREMAGLSRHAGVPVAAGEKWAAVTWWHERPYVTLD